MQAERPRPSVLAALPALLLGLGLLVTAVPRLVGELTLLPGDQAARSLYAGQQITAEGRERVVSTREDAAGWLDPARLERDLGMVALADARAPGITPERAEEALRDAVRRFTSVLAEAPADPYLWTFLALAHAQLRDIDRTVEALTLAQVVGRGASELAALRSMVSMAAWPWLDPVLKVAAGEDFVVALKRNGRMLASVALAADFTDLVRRRLDLEPPELRQTFDLHVAEQLCDSSFRGSGACAV